MSNAVPQGWLRLNLPDICFFQEGPGLRNWQYTTSGYPFINIRCIKEGYLDLENVQYISWDEANQKYQHFFLNEGDYVLSSSGTLGRMAKIRKRDLPLMLNTSVIRFRSKDDQHLYHDFLPHYLQSQVFVDQITEESQGSAQVNFGPTHLKLVECVLPPVPEQQKIAAILSSVDDVIEKTRAQIDKLKDLKTGMMQELLTKGIGHTEFKDSPVGRIPSSWACLELSDYISIGRGFAFKSEDYRESGRAILRVTNIARNGEIDLSSNVIHIDPDEAKKYKPYELRQGDILIVMVGATVGKLAVVPAHCENFLLNQNMWRLIVKDCQLYDQTFAYYALSPVIERFLSRQQGSARGFLTQKDFSQELIAMPPMHEQMIVSGMISSVDDKLRSQRAKYARLKNLKRALMQDLLTGKVRVSQKEPAVA